MLSTTAHELKTPLLVMSGYVDLLLSGKLGPLNPKQTDVLAEVKANSGRLKRFVDDYLTIGILETGKYAMSFEEHDLRDCLEQTYKIWLPLFTRKGVVCYHHTPDSLPSFRFDYFVVERVISNLLDNALKFTSSGGTVWLTGDYYDPPIAPGSRTTRAAPDAVCISVADTGCGIPPEYQHDIFTEFFRAPSHRGQTSGTGLGLSITRRLVQAHGGKIWVESAPNQGSTFSVLIPLTPPE